MMEGFVRPRGQACRVETERRGATTLIRLFGEFDLSFEEPFEAELARALDDHTGQLVVDLSGLGFMDSVGLRMLLTLENRSRAEDFALVVVCGDGQVREVLKLTGLDGLLPLVDPSGIVPASDSPI